MTQNRWMVILAGGGGTRLWPLSRRARPKQFLPLAPGGQSLLSATVERLAALVDRDHILVVTAASQQAEVRRVLPDLPSEGIVAEPAARNTAPAIALAATEIVRRGEPDAVMAVLPSDHVIRDGAAFRKTLESALALAQDHLVTVGIRPSRPETGYGYLELGSAYPHPGGGAFTVRRFIEKPTLKLAQEYAAAGSYLWNSGLFFFRAQRLLDEVARHLPDVARALATRYEQSPAISIDYGIMEKTTDILAVPGEFDWNDVGSWAALPDLHPADDDGNVRLGGPLVTADAQDNLIVGDGLVALAGVKGLCVVTSGDTVLVVPRERAQEVKTLVERLAKQGLDRYL